MSIYKIVQLQQDKEPKYAVNIDFTTQASAVYVSNALNRVTDGKYIVVPK